MRIVLHSRGLAVAELTLRLCMAFAVSLYLHCHALIVIRSLRGSAYLREYMLFRNKKLGIVGYGDIGQVKPSFWETKN